jgi:ribosomal protein S18 acetylase RimI-like enzyme
VPKPGPSDYSIQPLDAAQDRTSFASGVEPLDEYLRRQAGQDMRRRLAACFVLSRSDGFVAGYYTLSATSIRLSNLPASLARKLPRYPSVPATLLGRLAVHREHQGHGFGQFMLMDAFRRSLASEIATFAFVVDAKNDDARSFYERYGFRPLASDEDRLFIPMAEIAPLFA